MVKDTQRGAITLEACVSVLSFLILMLMLSSFFVIFMAQNVTAHTALQTSESLSLDVYTTNKMMVKEGTIGSTSGYVGQFVTKLFGSAENNPYYVTNDRWYDGDSTQIANTLKKRFIGYLSGGDEKDADYILKQMNVVDGINGLDFSKSYVANNTLYIVLNYELEFDFNIWNANMISVEQRTCSKLWK